MRSPVVGFASWYANASYRRTHEPVGYGGLNLVPGTEIGIGLGFATIGTVFICVGFKQRKRWKASLAQPSARVQLLPIVGPGQLGLVGRF